MRRPIVFGLIASLCIVAVPLVTIASSGFYWPDSDYLWENRNINRQLRFSVDGSTWGIENSDPDPWLNDSFIVTSNPFSFWILNHSRHQSLDDVLLWMAYRGSFSSITVDDITLTSADFMFSPSPPLGNGGNRPGGGEAGVYKNGWMAMSSLGEGLVPGATLMRTVTIEGASPDFMLHLDAYGAISTGGGFTIVSTNPNSSDVTFTPEPATIVLMGLGLTGVGVYLRKRKSKRS